jgi:NAD(P)-dependent dehydrogenase (short-subunit alcohol dehydrogenase family)
MKKLDGKIAVVTGASKGIGASIAKHLAAEGAAVVVNYASSKEGADRVVDEITRIGGKAIAVQANVSKKAEVEQLFVKTQQVFGRLDILVNNAGIYEYSGSQLSTIQLKEDKQEHLDRNSMKAYSIDLRQKIVEVYNNQEGSQRQLAKRFRVSLSFVQSLLQRYRQVGTVEPKAHGGGNPPKLSPEQLDVVEQLVSEDNDATLKELCLLLQQRTQVKVSRATMGRLVLSLKLTRKKNLPR